MKPPPWSVVVIVAVCVAAVTVLALAHVDATVLVAIITALAVPVVAGVYGEVRAVRHQTNGNTAALIELLRRQSDQLAASTPPAGTLSPAGPEPSTASEGQPAQH